MTANFLFTYSPPERAESGAQHFATIRSNLSTLHKQGRAIFHSLVLTFQAARRCLA